MAQGSIPASSLRASKNRSSLGRQDRPVPRVRSMTHCTRVFTHRLQLHASVEEIARVQRTDNPGTEISALSHVAFTFIALLERRPKRADQSSCAEAATIRGHYRETRGL